MRNSTVKHRLNEYTPSIQKIIIQLHFLPSSKPFHILTQTFSLTLFILIVHLDHRKYH